MQNRNSNVKIKQSQRTDSSINRKIKCRFIRERMLDMPKLNIELQKPVLEHLANCSQCREYYSKNYYSYLTIYSFNEKKYSLDRDTIIKKCKQHNKLSIHWKNIFISVIIISILLFLTASLELSFPYTNNIDHTQLTNFDRTPTIIYSEIFITFSNTLKTLLSLILLSAFSLYILFNNLLSIEKKGGYSCFCLC